MAKAPTSSVVLGQRRVRYATRVSAAAKRARIRVSPSGVEVVLQRGAEPGKAAAFLKGNASWVLAQIAFIERMRPLRRPQQSSVDKVLLRGQQVLVDVVGDESRRRYAIVMPVTDRLRVRAPRTHAIDIARAVQSWLRKQARADIAACVARRAREMRQRPGRLYIMDQRTKWANCSGRRNLSFNWRLVMAPPEVLDYIVVHELAHLIEPRHSPRFWLIVQSHCPDYETQRSWLRRHEAELKSWKVTLMPSTRGCSRLDRDKER